MTERRSDGGTTVDAESLGGLTAEPTVDGLRRRLVVATRQLGSLAITEIRLGLRRRWGAILIGLVTGFGLLIVAAGGATPGAEGVDRTVASLAMLCVYVVPLVGLAYGYDAVVGPAERGWLDVLSALPVTRSRILLGTLLGRLVVLTGGLAVGFVVPGALMVNRYGLGTVPVLARFLLATVALGAVFLGLAVGLSTLVGEKTHALGAALLAWVWFVLVSDLLALGVVATVELPDAAVTALVAANPTAVYRLLVLSAVGAGGAGGVTGVLTTGLSTGLLAAALVGWIVLPVAAAVLLVRRRGTVVST